MKKKLQLNICLTYYTDSTAVTYIKIRLYLMYSYVTLLKSTDKKADTPTSECVLVAVDVWFQKNQPCIKVTLAENYNTLDSVYNLQFAAHILRLTVDCHCQFSVVFASQSVTYIQRPLPDNSCELQVWGGQIWRDNFNQYFEFGLQHLFFTLCVFTTYCSFN